MSHRFLIKDIALQAGLGTATVDRVLNRRGGVRRQTVDRVRNAIAELEAQAGQLALTGRKLIVDLVVEAPQSFRESLDEALAAELPLMQPAVFRVRRDMRGRFPVPELEQALRRAGRLGSHGVILMAPDAARVRAAVDRLDAGGVPVVTLASDMPGTARRAYVGLDNARAGRTAAWVLRRWLAPARGARVLVTIRNDRFRGEEAREAGFRAAMAQALPRAQLHVLVQDPDDAGFHARVRALAARGLAAVYSIGGGNRRLLDSLEAGGRRRPLMIGHDLDAENRQLLREERLDMVLYHDFAGDIRNACRVIMAAHSRGAMPAPQGGAALRMAIPPMVD
ncbi:LacI family DNA-binding transcriptional regulator [Halovulum marinum]|nr:LacI family DNA-binding transcriptional regulator [Halovulum marinum]